MKRLLLLLLLFSIGKNVSAQNNAKVLAELFTSTTCPPCAGANTYFDNWLSTYPEKNNVVVIKYHVWWPSPGNDPYYLANTAHSVARNSYYSNNYAPHMFVNGTLDAGSSGSTFASVVASQISNKSPLTMHISISGSATHAVISITVSTTGSALPPGSYVLQTVLTESALSYNAPNGEKEFDHVMRMMYPDMNGETFTLDSNATKTFTRNIDGPSGWVIANCSIAAFVQNNSTRAVLQAESAPLDVLVKVDDRKIEIPVDCELLQNYPNPFNPSTIIPFQVHRTSFVELTVTDMLGRIVATLVNGRKSAGKYSVPFQAAGLPSGVYGVQVRTEGFRQMRLMMLLK